MEDKIFERVKLPYELNELEPYISRKIMDNHYNGNHKAYEKNLNLTMQTLEENVRAKFPELRDLLKNLSQLPISSEIKEKIRFYAGGLLNHNFFFRHLALNKKFVSSSLLKIINQKFGSLEQLKNDLIEQSLNNSINGIVYGSYWTWLVLDKKKNIKIIKTANQDSPWTLDFQPLVGIDMWEHAYVEQYGINKKKYLEALVHNCLDWEFISDLHLRSELFA